MLGSLDSARWSVLPWIFVQLIFFEKDQRCEDGSAQFTRGILYQIGNGSKHRQTIVVFVVNVLE